MNTAGWQGFVLTVLKMGAGIVLCLKGQTEIGSLLLGAGIYAAGKNGYQSQKPGETNAGK